MHIRISVIVTTYNRPDALLAVLGGLSQQRGIMASEWEVLVADDGSDIRTARVITGLQRAFGNRLHHVWHEDQGFRAAEIRNKAALQAQGDYLVFLDGDCIPQNDFIAKHMELAEPGWAVAGNRILLSESFTHTYLSHGEKPVSTWRLWDWLRHRCHGHLNNGLGWLRLSLPAWRKQRRDRWEMFRTCNVGVWRFDFFAVDGFDTAFSGWGYEDSDFAVRLLRHGIGIKNGRFAVPVLHLWHKENDRTHQDENWRRFESTLHGDHVRAKHGVSWMNGWTIE